MRKFSLDSSFVISYLSKEEKARKFLENAEFDKLLFPSVAKMEVKWGNTDISKFEELDVTGYGDKDSAKTVELKNYLNRKGKMINRLDLMIASQAINSNSILITSDKDYQQLEEIENFETIDFRNRRNE